MFSFFYDNVQEYNTSTSTTTSKCKNNNKMKGREIFFSSLLNILIIITWELCVPVALPC